MEPEPGIETTETINHEDYIIYDDEENLGGYPWNGALIASGLGAILIICFILPWIIGWVKMLQWIF